MIVKFLYLINQNYNMQKYFSILLLLLICNSVQAQLKLNIAGGINNNTNSNNDSTSFASRTGTAFSVKPSYHWGRVGIGAELGIAKHLGGNIDEVRNRLNVDTTARVNGIQGGGVATMSALVGPELCVCFKKIRIIPTIRVGVVSTNVKATTLQLGRAGAQGVDKQYRLAEQSTTDFATQAGLSVGYKISDKIAINLNGGFTSYKATFQVVDFRTSTTFPVTAKPVLQSYNFLKLATGITYSF